MAVYNSTPYQNFSTFPTGKTTTTVGKEDSSVGDGFQYWWGFGIVGAIILLSICRTRNNRATAQRRPVASIVPTNNETRNEQQPLQEQTSLQPVGSPIPMSFDPNPPEYDAIMTLNGDTRPPHYSTVNTSSNLDKSVTENDPP
uniref:Uncharacterized protein n=1 Tax=Ciona savignyi TaxID=51511 RepID=H2Z5W4_CIOSA